MSNADILGFASALFCSVLALIVAWNKRRSVAHWAFVAGMGAGRGRRMLRPYSGRRFTGGNGLLAELEVGCHVISARDMAFFQPELCPRELFGVSETVAFCLGCGLPNAHWVGNSVWQ